MICSQCQRSGYGFQKINGKAWCGGCEAPGTRTLTQSMAESRQGFNPYGTGGVGTLDALPKLCTIAEWREVAKLCRVAANDRLLFEEMPMSTKPLPNLKNPLNGPDRTGWTPLDEYLKETPKPKKGNPYGFTPIEDYFKPNSHDKSCDFNELKRLMEG